MLGQSVEYLCRFTLVRYDTFYWLKMGKLCSENLQQKTLRTVPRTLGATFASSYFILLKYVANFIFSLVQELKHVRADSLRHSLTEQ